MDGKGGAEAVWYEKDSKTPSEEYSKKSVLDMLPEILKNNIKEVGKIVMTGFFNLDFEMFKAKIFPLSAIEYNVSQEKLEQWEPYQYWVTHSENSDRQLLQVKCADGAITSPLTWSSSDIKYYSWAGYNMSTYNGCPYWARTYTNSTYDLGYIGSKGNTNFARDTGDPGTRYAELVAHAFCI